MRRASIILRMNETQCDRLLLLSSKDTKDLLLYSAFLVCGQLVLHGYMNAMLPSPSPYTGDKYDWRIICCLLLSFVVLGHKGR